MGREVDIVLEEARRGEKLCFSETMWRLLHTGNDTVATKETAHRAGPMRMINIGLRQGAQPSTGSQNASWSLSTATGAVSVM